MNPLTLERDEFELAQRIWTWLLASGHADCGGWQRDPAWAAGHVECACGQVVLVPGSPS